MNYDKLIRKFLKQNPEYISEVRQHPQLGTAMTTDCVEAFAAWCLKKGFIRDSEKAKAFVKALRGFEAEHKSKE